MAPLVRLYSVGGGSKTAPLADVLLRLEAKRLPLCPTFAVERVDLIGRFAARLQQNARWRGSAAVGALAFWLRKAAMTRMAEDFRARAHPNSISTGRGIAFHLPPQNVDTLFLYSWATSFACGNINVVRLPERMPPVMAELLESLLYLLEESAAGDLFITYPKEDEAVNRQLSAAADCRLVWGGEAKAEAFNRLPLRLGGKSLIFGDRYSHAILSAEAVAALDQAALDRLARALHDDIRLFDQQACSSPHMIHVLDASAAAMPAVGRLLRSVDDLARNAPSVDPAHGMAKFAASCAMAAADTISSANRLSNETTVVDLVAGERRGRVIGGGFLSIRKIETIDELTDYMTGRDQTVAHFGLGADRLSKLADLAARRGVARLVPIGSALAFDQLWDGYDLVAELSRVTRVMAASGGS